MKSITNYLSKYKSRYQKIILFILASFPLLMFIGAENENTFWILIGLIFVAGANIVAIVNK